LVFILASVLALTNALGEDSSLPYNSSAVEKIKTQLVRNQIEQNFSVSEFPRFIVISDTSPNDVSLVGNTFEVVANTFENFLNEISFKGTPLSQKLLCLFFDKKYDYLEYSKKVEGLDSSFLAGYFDNFLNRILFSKMDEFGNKRTGPKLTAVVSHEITHMLSFNRGFQSAHAAYPLWIAEGLAMLFETENIDKPFGPEIWNHRGEKFLRIQPEERIPLNDIVGLTALHPNLDNDIAIQIYDEIYALTFWLYHHKRDAFFSYLEDFRVQGDRGNNRYLPDQHRELFEKYFGDIALVEREWIASN
jgi:hypothetical protein